MDNKVKEFGNTAVSLSRNPLGIIALFIVLVYGLASMVTVFSSSFTEVERRPLIYFLVIFPVLVLIVFSWLVSRHSQSLFAPSDFENEENYVKLQLSAIASISTAVSNKLDNTETKIEVDSLISLTNTISKKIRAHEEEFWKFKILWVDDHPENNLYERNAFESIGLCVTIALSTNEALMKLENSRFAVIISDMGRKEGAQEGYVLLEAIRSRGLETPFFVYAGSGDEKHKEMAISKGAQGSTNDPQELFKQVLGEIGKLIK